MKKNEIIKLREKLMELKLLYVGTKKEESRKEIYENIKQTEKEYKQILLEERGIQR